MPTSIKSHNEKPSSKKRKAVFLRAEKRILRDVSFFKTGYLTVQCVRLTLISTANILYEK